MTSQQVYIARANPLVYTRRAGAADRAKLWVLLTLPPLALAAAAFIALWFSSPTPFIVFLLAALGVLSTTLIAASKSGQSWAHRALRLRTVDKETGSPAARRVVLEFLKGRLTTFDISNGRDPISNALQPFDFSVASDFEGDAWSPAISKRAWVKLDSGEEIEVIDALRVGRKPHALAHEKVKTFEWPDMSRTLSKSHLTIEWDRGELWITDMGSTNGTVLVLEANDRFLQPHKRVKVPPNTIVVAGERRLTLTVST